ncbi:MAG: DUF1573 domain-containing protein [Ignavibacteriae bacterium]|nr:MAG: DUF1573 domain-containing protein [Ignavibacteriota bacterium]
MKSENIKKIAFFVIGLFVVGAFSAFLISKKMHDPALFGPTIYFTEEKHDFGEVKQGPAVLGEFEFMNTGQETLIIKGVTASCGCTSAMVDEKKEFAPGEKGKIKYTFNTEGRNGVNEKIITVESNDVKNPRKTLSFTCNIVVP